jgi:hypothetical protein
MWFVSGCWAPLVVRADGLTFDPLEITKALLEHQTLHPVVWVATEGGGYWRDHEGSHHRAVAAQEEHERQIPPEIRQLQTVAALPPDAVAARLVGGSMRHEDPRVREASLGATLGWAFPPSFDGRQGRPLRPHAIDPVVKELESLAEALLADPDASVRANTVLVLCFRDFREWLLANPQAVSAAPDAERLVLSAPLSAHTSDRLQQALEREQNAEVRLRLLGALFRASDPDARVSAMLEALRDNKRARHVALDAIRSLDQEPEIVLRMLARAQSADEEIQLAALSAVARLRRSVALLRALEAWAEEEQRPPVRMALAGIIERWRPKRRE